MANIRLLQLPTGELQTGTSFYLVDEFGNSIRGTLETIAAYFATYYNFGSGLSPFSPTIYIGSGSPEGVVAAVSGSIYTDWFNRTFYQKVSGSNTIGWI